MASSTVKIVRSQQTHFKIKLSHIIAVLTIIIIAVFISTLVQPQPAALAFILTSEEPSLLAWGINGGSVSVGATASDGTTFSVTAKNIDNGCHYEGSINGISLPSLNDPHPCSTINFWSWWITHAANKVKEVVGEAKMLAIKNWIYIWIH